MADIKTRILLRNDTLANWEAANSVTLKAGEVGIAMLDGALAELRVGNNTTWANSKKLRVEAGQISGLIDTINAQINGLTYEYQLTAGTGDDLNKWFLEKRHLSGGEWESVSTVDLTQLTGYALSTDVDTLVATVSAATYTSAVDDANSYTNTTVESISTALSTDYVGKIGDLETAVNTLVAEVSAATYTSAYNDAKSYTNNAVDALSIDNYMLTSDFNALSNEIGLSAASSSNPIVTKNDIADLAGAMHFRGAVTPTSGQSDADAIAAYYTAEGLTPEAGDIVIITTNSKEYVYSGTAWVELGDEVLYATKAEVATVSADLSTDYVGKIGDLETTVNTLVSEVSVATYTSAVGDANTYTNDAIEAISGDIDTLVNSVSVALSNDYVDKIGDLSDATNTLVAEVSAATYTSAYNDAKSYTDDAVATLSIDDYIKHGEVTSDDLSGYFVFDCGSATYRTGEQAATEA